MNEFSSVESNNRVRVSLLKQCGKIDKPEAREWKQWGYKGIMA
jgi:hypothetical protein